MWLVKEDLVGKRVRVVQLHDGKILWRGVVRGLGFQGSFRLLVEIDELVHNQGTYGSRLLGELAEFPIGDEYITVLPEK
jgi:hypothetical protein